MVEDILNIDEMNLDDNNIYLNSTNENQENETKKLEFIKNEGVILENKKLGIDLNEKIFVQDKCYEFCVFENENKQKSIKFFKRISLKQTFFNFNIVPHTLCIIGIKTQFPPNEKDAKNKKTNDQENSFYSMLKNFIKNALVFKTI